MDVVERNHAVASPASKHQLERVEGQTVDRADALQQRRRGANHALLVPSG